MLLSSVILVLREVLEAALLISLLMALSTHMGRPCRWVGIAIAFGMTGAALYGFNIDIISDWFDGVGQEVVNASLQIGIYFCMCIIAVLGSIWSQSGGRNDGLLVAAMILTVATAVVREGSEVLVYLTGFIELRELLPAMLVGSAIGAGIGASAGAVFYYGLVGMRSAMASVVGLTLLAMVSGGMVMQAMQLLIQADWLPSGYPFWDSSWLVEEGSVTGQLLYALVGYESAPTALQLVVYLAAVACILLLPLAVRRERKSLATPHAKV